MPHPDRTIEFTDHDLQLGCHLHGLYCSHAFAHTCANCCFDGGKPSDIVINLRIFFLLSRGFPWGSYGDW